MMICWCLSTTSLNFSPVGCRVVMISIVLLNYLLYFAAINSSQLAYMENHEFCEMKFGATFRKTGFVNLSLNLSKNLLHICDRYNCDYLWHIIFCFHLIDFQLNTNFHSQFCVFKHKVT